jgi:predicted AAA+ superfamily ATPase
MSLNEFTFKHPTTIQISGPSQCGKTRLLLKLLENKLIQPFPSKIIWVYSEWQPDYEQAGFKFDIEFINGWNDGLYNMFEPVERNLLVVDD